MLSFRAERVYAHLSATYPVDLLGDGGGRDIHMHNDVERAEDSCGREACEDIMIHPLPILNLIHAPRQRRRLHSESDSESESAEELS